VSSTNNLKAHAIDMAERGLRVFQIKAGTKDRPLGKWKQLATADPKMAAALWSGNPSANIGIACGVESGVLVIDLDIKGGKDGAAAMRARGIELPKSHVQRSPTGGYHVFMRYPAGSGITTGIDLFHDESGVDWRGEGGYVLGAGSVTENGTYTRLGDWTGEYPECPPELVALLPGDPQRSLDRVDRAFAAARPPAAPIPEKLPKGGSRHKHLVSLAGSLRSRGATPAEILDALRPINAARCDPPLDDQWLKKIADSVGEYPADPDVPSPPRRIEVRTLAELCELPDPPAADRIIGDQVTASASL
jgi:putative DNA primase/helicase